MLRRVTHYSHHELNCVVPMVVLELELAAQPRSDPMEEASNGN